MALEDAKVNIGTRGCEGKYKIKGTVVGVSSDPPCKLWNVQFTTLENLNLIFNVEDSVVSFG